MYLVLCLFQACSAGLTGNNCSIPCRYPSFGNYCQSICNCNNSSCDAVTGCIGKFKYSLSFVWYNYSNAFFLSPFGYFNKLFISCWNVTISKLFVLAVLFNIRSMLMFSSTYYYLLVGSPTLHPVSKSSPVVESSHFLDNKISTSKR